LQWSRGLASSEITFVVGPQATRDMTSMEPRTRVLGNATHSLRHEVRHETSMEPRTRVLGNLSAWKSGPLRSRELQWSRGLASSEIRGFRRCGQGHQGDFNGAEDSRPRKWARPAGPAGDVDEILQWSRGLASSEIATGG